MWHSTINNIQLKIKRSENPLQVTIISRQLTSSRHRLTTRTQPHIAHPIRIGRTAIDSHLAHRLAERKEIAPLQRDHVLWREDIVALQNIQRNRIGHIGRVAGRFKGRRVACVRALAIHRRKVAARTGVAHLGEWVRALGQVFEASEGGRALARWQPRILEFIIVYFKLLCLWYIWIGVEYKCSDR